jgi:hypothetical protein
MARNWFVTPEVVRLPLSDGHWIDVKRRLSVGEERDAFQQIVGEVNGEGWRRPNFKLVGLAEVAAYIVQWSLVDAAGIPVPFSLDAMQNLDPAAYREIDAAVDAHKTRVEAQRAAEKNGSDGATAPATTSPSASAWDGATGN